MKKFSIFCDFSNKIFFSSVFECGHDKFIRKIYKYIPVYLVLLFLIVGCSLPAVKLDLSSNADVARKGPLSSLKPLKIEIKEFIDMRAEKDLIGWLPGMMGGSKGRKLITERPVARIIRKALASEFKKNGHIIKDDGNDVSISGEIHTFSWEYKFNILTIESFGTVSVVLKVFNVNTGKVIYTRRYQGHHAPGGRGLLTTTTNAATMNSALEQMIRQISTDPKLIKVLRSL